MPKHLQSKPEVVYLVVSHNDDAYQNVYGVYATLGAAKAMRNRLLRRAWYREHGVDILEMRSEWRVVSDQG
jgi:hypothetical protein